MRDRSRVGSLPRKKSARSSPLSAPSKSTATPAPPHTLSLSRAIRCRRDKACDIRIVNKEVSRRHLELSVNEVGLVCVASLGREPVLVNKEQVLLPRVLQTGDKIEVLLEGRTREFFFRAAPQKAVSKKETNKSLGSPLMASSIVNRCSDAGIGEVVEGMEVVEADDGGASNAAPLSPPSQPDAISAAVTKMVQDIIDRVLTSVDAAASILTPVRSSVKRKSVRFVAASTPEGDARDATMTIRCLPREECQQHDVLVEDNTLAISEWGFKTMKNEAEDGKDGNEDTCDVGAMADQAVQQPIDEAVGMKVAPDETAAVQAAHADDADEDKEGQQLTPASIGVRVPLTDQYRTMSSPNKPNRLNFEAPVVGATSQGTPGVARAPATTPVTAAKPFIVGQERGRDVDFLALAQKLEEIAEEHDVKFELPKDFMRFTPVPSVTKSKRKSLGEALSSRSVGRTPKRLSISSNSKEASFEYDLPHDFMRFTPMNLKSAIKNVEQTMTAVGGIHESLDDGAEEIATLRNVAHVVHDLADALDNVASTKKSVRAKTPGVKITIVEKGSAFKTVNPEVKILFNTGQAPVVEDDVEGAANGAEVADVPMEQADEAGSAGEGSQARKALGDPNSAKGGTATVEAVDTNHTTKDLIARFKAALGQAQSYKTQALVLGKHLKKSSAKLCRVQATSRVLSIKYRAEKAKRMELQNMIIRLIEDREAAMDGSDAGDDAETSDIHELPANLQPRVVVLGAEESRPVTHIEMAGDVTVVRPSAALIAAGTPAPVRRARRSSAVPGKSVTKSVKRVSVGGQMVRVLVDNVEVPQWVFDEEKDQELPGDAGEADATLEADTQDEDNALEKLVEALKNPLPSSPTKEEKAHQASIKDQDDNDESSSDACFVCGVGDDGDILLLCDACDNACHLGCCKPARKTVPKGDWFCAPCKAVSKKRKAEVPTTKAAKENVATKKALTTKSKATAANKPTRSVRASRRATSTKP